MASTFFFVASAFRRKIVAIALLTVVGADFGWPVSGGGSSASAGPQQRPPSFRTAIELIYVNVVVRDKSGQFVRGLTREDFTLLEDDRPQTITAFDFEEVPSEPVAEPAADLAESTPRLLVAPVKPAGQASPAAVQRESGTASTEANRLRPDSAQEASSGKQGSGGQEASAHDDKASPYLAKGSANIDLNNRRLIVLLFDVTSMQPEELDRAITTAREYVTTRVTPADLVAIASVSSALQIDQDFTTERDRLVRVLDRYAGADTAGFEEGAVPAEEAADPAEGFIPDDTEFNIFNTDRRLQAIELLAEALSPIHQKKSIVYFSGGMGRTGEDNQVQLRAAIDRAVKANISIYPVDTRGLTAIVPGGEARQASGRGTGMFSGRSVAQQFDRQAASQETLVTLASDTGGRAFFDTNELGGVFTRVIADTSAYYLLGYTSTNPVRDGRFRRMRVRVNRPGLRIEHRNGYYADKDFAHSNRDDRERQLQEQLQADLSSTDLTVWVSSSYFRLADDRFYLPISIAVPGSRIPAAGPNQADRATFDILGVIRDELQRPVGRIRDTIRLSAQQSQDVRRTSLQYDTGFTLPPGRYTFKVVLRENQNGTIGSFESTVAVPDLRKVPVKLSTVVLGSQIQKAGGRSTASPLSRDGTTLVPSLTHVVSTRQPVYFYYEMYDPAVQAGAPRVLTSISFFRGRVRVYETPLVEATRLTAPDRKAAIFQLAVPASALKPGLYTCQVTIVDDVAGSFAFPRLPLLVRQ